ncbi:MAG: PhnD/SsuA/transferrin family substrate-binding protein, partial [Gammaproteobacteria bacterium]|nr:PhnD/SsuA/transferrin family substrate-binding protein [Gammaproteobacteria bacterium]
MAHQRIILLLLTCLLLITQVDAKEFTVGVRAHTGIDKTTLKWQPTIDYLNARFPQHHFTLLPIVSLKQISDMAGQGAFDFVITNPASYVDMELKYGASRLLTQVNKRQGKSLKKFGAAIFTLKTRNDINTLSDLRNKSLIAVSERAFGGWAMAWLELKKQQIDPDEDLASLSYAKGIQPEVVKAVLAGKADVGVVRSDMLEGLANQGIIKLDDIKIISPVKNDGYPFMHSTPLYPEWAFAYLPKVADNIAKEISIALMQMPSDSPAAIAGQYMGWTIPMDYQPVHDLMKELHLGPYENYGKVPFTGILKIYRGWIVLGFMILMSALVTAIYVLSINRKLSSTSDELELAHTQLESLLQQRTHQLEKTETQQKTLLETVVDGILTLDAAGYIREINPAAEKMFGYQANEVLGKNFS